MEGLVPLQKVFEYEGKRVRAIVHNGQPWFANKDACDILGHSNPTNVPQTLVTAKGVEFIARLLRNAA